MQDNIWLKGSEQPLMDHTSIFFAKKNIIYNIIYNIFLVEQTIIV